MLPESTSTLHVTASQLSPGTLPQWDSQRRGNSLKTLATLPWVFYSSNAPGKGQECFTFLFFIFQCTVCFSFLAFPQVNYSSGPKMQGTSVVNFSSGHDELVQIQDYLNRSPTPIEVLNHHQSALHQVMFILS